MARTVFPGKEIVVRTLAFSLIILVALLCAATALAQQPESNTEPVAWIGVTLRSSQGETPDEESGARVTGVVRESPADKAGLRGGDLVLEAAGSPVLSTREFIQKVQQFDSGDWIELKIKRQGRERLLSARLGTRPGRDRLGDIKRAWSGVLPVDVPIQLREFWGGSEEAGVLVGAIAEGSPAEVAGLLPGDMILSVDGAEIADAFALIRRIAESGVGNTIELEVSRQGTPLELEVDLTEPPPQPDKRSRPKDS